MTIHSARIQPAVIITDCHGDHVLVNGSVEDATLLFIDLIPEANWAHDCLYLLVQSDGRVKKAYHQWPPSERLSGELVTV